MTLAFQTHQQCEHLSSTIVATMLPLGSELRPAGYGPGTPIWGIGSLPNCVYRLRSGRVDIVSVDMAGKELLVRAVKPGEIFGEVCFCSYRSEPYGLIARSAVRSEVVKVTYQQFRHALQRDNRLMEAVLQEFCCRLGDQEERIRILALHDARQRLSRLLVYLARLRGVRSTSRAGAFTLNTSHSELAALSALSRPHVSLLMTQFRKRGWVSYRRGGPLLIHCETIPAS